ncbi:hypothetical protein [Mycobacterium kubicae]|uniref:Uncharacterized protein n=1 Tax=Mycobacterium kubicae TaxID=120959 RepID=A0AAX1J6G3_9MYCO|nr:hypothetical protein [Mycobacterium kubicae]QNI13277.1 hypothetical protein GAN18_20720 [Mycobacterium kubicae]QPI36796.1 hypothetical protein I2456_20390 [Mycobacterium kubicae]
MFYVMTVSTPSNGLTPERRSSSIVAFDPFASAPPQLAPWPPEVSVQQLAPSNYGFYAKTSNGLIGFDGTTLQSTFTCTDNNRAGNCWHNFAGFGKFREDGSGGEVFFRARDGGQVGENVGSTMSGGVPMSTDGMVVTVGNTFPYRYGYFDFRDAKIKEIASEFNLALWDNDLMEWGTDYIRVLDLTNNRVLFERTGDDVKNLHIKQVHFAGKYLYIDNDSDRPVIDITTWQKVSSGWKVMPIQRVSRDWILIDPKNPNRDQSCFSKEGQFCYVGQDSQLVFAPSGDYVGPWF